MHGIVSLLGKSPPAYGWQHSAPRIMVLSIDADHNLSILMHGPIPRYGVSAIIEPDRAASPQRLIRAPAMLDQLRQKVRKIDKFAINDAQRRSGSFVTALPT